MPLPTPSQDESKDKFVSRCISFVKHENSKTPDKQAQAMCFSQWKKKSSTKERRYCKLPISIREEGEEFYSEGFIATTHPDRAEEDGYNSTMLSKKAIQQICDYINDRVATTKGVGSTRAVSYRHDWVKEQDPEMLPAGMALPPAEVRQTDDGHWGVWAKVHHNKAHEKYEDIIYGVQHGYIPGYSVEFVEGDVSGVSVGGNKVKLIDSIDNFVGFAFADARMIANPAAVIQNFGYREIIKHGESEEVNKMEEEKPEEKPEKEEETPEEEKEEAPKEEEKEEEPKEEVSQKEVKLNTKEIASIVSETVKSELSKVPVKSKVVKTKEVDYSSIITKELNSAIENENQALKWREVVEKHDLINKALESPSSYGDFKNRTCALQNKGEGLKVRCVGKGLRLYGDVKVRATLDTNENASTYTQAPVEFADLFAPGIIDTFNNQTNLFGFLKKEQHPGGIMYQWKMICNRDEDSQATFYDRDDATVRKTFTDKNNYQTPIKVARRGVSVTDFTLRYSSSSLGDLMQLEIDQQMRHMMKTTNQALFAEVADGTGNAPLGLEAVADHTGNTTIYGFTRSAANRLRYTTALTEVFVSQGGALTEAALRVGITQLEKEGTEKGNIAIVTSPGGRDFLFNLLDGERRFNNTDAMFGFNRMQVPSYDGIPIIVDVDCTSTVVDANPSYACYYFIDTDADVIVMAMEPRVVSLAKVSAATEAYIEMHFAHVYKQPRRIHCLDDVQS